MKREELTQLTTTTHPARYAVLFCLDLVFKFERNVRRAAAVVNGNVEV